MRYQINFDRVTQIIRFDFCSEKKNSQTLLIPNDRLHDIWLSRGFTNHPVEQEKQNVRCKVMT